MTFSSSGLSTPIEGELSFTCDFAERTWAFFIHNNLNSLVNITITELETERNKTLAHIWSQIKGMYSFKWADREITLLKQEKLFWINSVYFSDLWHMPDIEESSSINLLFRDLLVTHSAPTARPVPSPAGLQGPLHSRNRRLWTIWRPTSTSGAHLYILDLILK